MRQWIILGLVLLLGCAAAEAADVNEFEAAGTASNNSLATAQAIPPSAFTLPVPPTVFDPPGFRTASLIGRGGGSDVDIFRISGHGTLLLDIDNDVINSFLDTALVLFDSSGVVLARGLDGPVDDGTVTSHDALLVFDLPGPGVYFVAVSSDFNVDSGCSPALPGCTLDNAFGSNGPQPEDAPQYLLYLSLEHPHRVGVPAPAALILVVAAGGVVGAMSVLRRRR